jgi:hypothetical protein
MKTPSIVAMIMSLTIGALSASNAQEVRRSRNSTELHSASGVITLYDKLPVAAMTIGIIHFRDCVVLDHVEDCQGSGEKAGLIYATAFAGRKGAKITLLPRSLSAFDELTDAAAVAMGREKSVEYIVAGEVLDYSGVAAMSFRSDRASVSIRLLRVIDGMLLATQKEAMVGGSNFSNPTRLLRGAADRFRKAI